MGMQVYGHACTWHAGVRGMKVCRHAGVRACRCMGMQVCVACMCRMCASMVGESSQHGCTRMPTVHTHAHGAHACPWCTSLYGAHACLWCTCMPTSHMVIWCAHMPTVRTHAHGAHACPWCTWLYGVHAHACRTRSRIHRSPWQQRRQGQSARSGVRRGGNVGHSSCTRSSTERQVLAG